MVNEIRYVNIKEILSRLLRHPLLLKLDLETVLQYTIDFIGIVGMPKFYLDKETSIEIKNYKGLMPCDLISIKLIKHNGLALRSMTDSFFTKENLYTSTVKTHPVLTYSHGEETFKTLHNIIYTSFKCGIIDISYKAIPVDDEGYPLLIDNPVFLKALEEYIKFEYFTILFDLGKISEQVLANQSQRYYLKVNQVQSEFTIPSVSEMESITRMFNTLIPRLTDFDNGFISLGNREYIKRH